MTKGPIHQEFITLINVYVPKKKSMKILETKTVRTKKRHRQILVDLSTDKLLIEQ